MKLSEQVEQMAERIAELEQERESIYVKQPPYPQHIHHDPAWSDLKKLREMREDIRTEWEESLHMVKDNLLTDTTVYFDKEKRGWQVVWKLNGHQFNFFVEEIDLIGDVLTRKIADVISARLMTGIVHEMIRVRKPKPGGTTT